MPLTRHAALPHDATIDSRLILPMPLMPLLPQPLLRVRQIAACYALRHADAGAA